MLIVMTCRLHVRAGERDTEEGRSRPPGVCLSAEAPDTSLRYSVVRPVKDSCLGTRRGNHAGALSWKRESIGTVRQSFREAGTFHQNAKEWVEDGREMGKGSLNESEKTTSAEKQQHKGSGDGWLLFGWDLAEGHHGTLASSSAVRDPSTFPSQDNYS